MTSTKLRRFNHGAEIHGEGLGDNTLQSIAQTAQKFFPSFKIIQVNNGCTIDQTRRSQQAVV